MAEPDEREALAKALFLADVAATDPNTGERMWANLTAARAVTSWHEQAGRVAVLGVGFRRSQPEPTRSVTAAEAWDEGYEAAQAAADDCCACDLYGHHRQHTNPYRTEAS